MASAFYSDTECATTITINNISRTYDANSAKFLAKKVTICTFDGSESHCKKIHSVLQLCDPQLFTQTKALDNKLFSDDTKSGFKPLVLLPGRLECCGKRVVIR